jgi:hypothetical protein
MGRRSIFLYFDIVLWSMVSRRPVSQRGYTDFC